MRISLLLNREWNDTRGEFSVRAGFVEVWHLQTGSQRFARRASSSVSKWQMFYYRRAANFADVILCRVISIHHVLPTLSVPKPRDFFFIFRFPFLWAGTSLYCVLYTIDLDWNNQFVASPCPFHSAHTRPYRNVSSYEAQLFPLYHAKV